jgi:hypothetical protein
MDFDKIWYLSFRKSVEKIQVSLKSDKNNGYITWKRFNNYDNISLNSFRMRNVLDKSGKENQNTDFMLDKVFFYENRTVYEIMWKNWWSQKRRR